MSIKDNYAKPFRKSEDLVYTSLYYTDHIMQHLASTYNSSLSSPTGVDQSLAITRQQQIYNWLHQHGGTRPVITPYFEGTPSHLYRHPVLIMRYGFERVLELTYQRYFYDHPLLSRITLEHFQYTAACVLLRRIHHVSARYGSTIPLNTEELNILDRIKLPSIICTFIESIGSVDVNQAMTIIPWIGSTFEEHVKPPNSINHQFYLGIANRSPVGEWCIDQDWISEYRSLANTQLTSSQARIVDNQNLHGNSCMYSFLRFEESFAVDIYSKFLSASENTCISLHQ
jgi:hypothetical protein